MVIDFTLNLAVLLNLVLTIAGFVLIKFNDFRHLGKDFTKLDKRVESINNDISTIKTDIAVLKQKTKDN